MILTDTIEIANLDRELQFQIRVQVSLRLNALNIMTHYDRKEKFEKYVMDREEKIKMLLGTNKPVILTFNGVRLFP
jgi:hypothetical protein